MHPISAVIITKNEERNIERTIRALKQVADEIIIVDNFSIDKTVEISEAFVGTGIRVKDFSIGVNAGYLFGNKNYSTRLSFFK